MVKRRPQKFTERLQLRLTPEELKIFKEAADAEGMDVSAWMRRACKRTAKREERRRDEE
ncbi:MAG: DUF1778 domain-containing protein [Patescibacteria group bacterium]|nr:DUF1778 domain-containing protein [Patescibacteria group bacterium]